MSRVCYILPVEGVVEICTNDGVCDQITGGWNCDNENGDNDESEV